MEGQLLTSSSMKNTADLDNEDKTACVESYGTGNNYYVSGFIVYLYIHAAIYSFLVTCYHCNFAVSCLHLRAGLMLPLFIIDFSSGHPDSRS